MSPELIRSLALSLFAGLVILAAVTDLASFTIPNWISAALALAFAPVAFAAGISLGAIGLNFAVGVGVLAAAAGMFALGWLGGGDAKLMTAAAVWLGLKGVAPFVVFTGLAGGALSAGAARSAVGLAAPLHPEAPPAWARRLATPRRVGPLRGRHRCGRAGRLRHASPGLIKS